MSASTTLRPREGSPARWRSLAGNDLVMIVVAAGLAVVATAWLAAGPDRVALTIVNDTAYEVTVTANQAADGESSRATGWAPVTVLDPGERRDGRPTLDQGDRWSFRFTGQGRSGGELTLTRDELAANDWTLVVPHTVVERLESEGATPPPRSR